MGSVVVIKRIRQSRKLERLSTPESGTDPAATDNAAR
jgi:hypothetical protein